MNIETPQITYRLSAVSHDPRVSGAHAVTALSSHWSGAQRPVTAHTAVCGRVVADYVMLLVDLYACCGLPVLYDHELMHQAERAVTLQDAKAVPGRVPGVKLIRIWVAPQELRGTCPMAHRSAPPPLRRWML